MFVFGGLSGSSVAPGVYTLRLTLEEERIETAISILPNPAINSTIEDFTAQQKMLVTIENTLQDIHTFVNQMRSAKNQLTRYAKLLKNDKQSTISRKGFLQNKTYTSR